MLPAAVVVLVKVVAVVDVTEVLAAVSSSFLAHDPISATMPTIKTIQNSNFFIIASFIIEKCRIIPTFMYREWC
jgi:hypothetical protein